MGTGGGEFLLTLEHPYKNTTVTEAYPPNIELCRERLGGIGIEVVAVIDDNNLPIDDNCFDIVINRHEAFSVSEVSRILRNNGIFITQQVGAENNRSLSERLVPNFKPQFNNNTLTNCVSQLKENGFKILYSKEEFPKVYFYDAGAVAYYAKIIEWEFPGFSVDKCFSELCEISDEIVTNGYIVTRQHRFIIVAEKI